MPVLTFKVAPILQNLLLSKSNIAVAVVQGLDRLAEYDYVAIFDADFKPDADFLVS